MEPDDEDLRSRGDLGRSRKADEARLASLAKSLAELPRKQLAKLDIDESIREAVDEARRMKSHVARDRQLRIVRRELRSGDHAAIAEALEELLHHGLPQATTADPAEAELQRLLDEGDAAVERLVAQHDRADRQQLRALLRNARGSDAKRVKKARKALLELIRELR